MHSDISVERETLLPIVSKYFENISPAQWCLLSEGHFDSKTGATLADMCTEMTQKLSTDALKIIIPVFRQRVDDTKVDRLTPVPEGATNSAFASALSIPLQQCDSASKLDSLLTDEVSERVNRTLASATHKDAQQLVPLMYIPGTFTSLNVLYQMVRLACNALWTYLGHVESRTRCFGACWRQPSGHKHHGRIQVTQIEEHQSPKSSCSPKSNISVDETTEAVTKILRKWSDCSNTEPADVPLEAPPPDVQGTASDIVTTIVGDLHYAADTDSNSSRSVSPHFDLRLIEKTLTNFFSTHIQMSPCKNSFIEFSKMRFDKMMDDVVSQGLWKDSEYLVIFPCLPDDVGAVHPEVSLPGSITTTLSFEGIRDDVEGLFNNFATAGTKVTKSHETLNDEITLFSKKLRDKIYNHVQVNQTTGASQFAGTQTHGRRKRKKRHADVLFNIVEDSVGKFLQQMLLWMEMESRKRKARTNAVCGALNDIDMLMSSLESSDERNSSLQLEASASAAQQRETQSHAASLTITPATLEKLARSLISMLILSLVKHFPKKVKKSMGQCEVQLIISKVYGEVLNEVNLESLATMDMVTYSKFIQAVIEDLSHQYRSKKKLLETFKSNSDLFRDAVLKHLMSNLNAYKDGVGRSKMKRFFAVLFKPFTP